VLGLMPISLAPRVSATPISGAEASTAGVRIGSVGERLLGPRSRATPCDMTRFLVLTLVGLTMAACGGQSAKNEPAAAAETAAPTATKTPVPVILTGTERQVVAGAELAAAEYALAVLEDKVDRAKYSGAVDAVDEMIALFRAKPDATEEYDAQTGKQTGRTVKQVLSDIGSKLAQADPEMADKVDRALAAE
jgi:hypothetical protein